MNRQQAIRVLSDWDRRGHYVFSLHDLAKLFPLDKPKTLKEGVNRLVRDGLLKRACRGVYIYLYAHSMDSHTVEQIAKTLRRGEYNYVSLESALSEYGAISQMPIDRLTVMTTGRKGTYQTPYGIIEFTHTKRPVRDIIQHIRDIKRPLRIATPQTAWRDLKRVGRNTHLVNQEVLQND
jgi:predicted transcriptional regulator of viral defense system